MIEIEFKDRIVEFPNRYSLTDNGDGTYTLIPFPGEITEEGTPINAANMNEIVQKHNALYDTVIPRLFSIPKRDVDGKIIYALEASDDAVQNHVWGDLIGFTEMTHTFRTLNVKPAFKKRFMRVEFKGIIYFGSGSGGMSGSFELRNAATEEVLYTFTNMVYFGAGDPEESAMFREFTTNLIIEQGETLPLKIVSLVTVVEGTSRRDVGTLLKDFRVYTEDVEFSY
ncbi:MAG: hypothetical protein BWY15_02478 [Firmicutes bacterium ADurb.Bin193]|nr:MAG: hypothetical protein BWY15_02478 [Firmicutes bacterium ADurb.Bin193]